MIDPRKVVIIGCGYVGSACAFALMQHGLYSEMVLIDANAARAEGEAEDIAHGLLFAKPTDIRAGSYADAADASLAIVTAGANQKPGETRLDLVKRNAAILLSVLGELERCGFAGNILVVSNPVDVLTRVAQRHADLPESRVFGSGTVLDTARLRYLLGEHLRVDNRSVHAFIVGEHGDSEIALWSSATVSGVPLRDFCEMRGYFDHENAMREIGESVKTAPIASSSARARPITASRWPSCASARRSCATNGPSCPSRPPCTASSGSRMWRSACRPSSGARAWKRSCPSRWTRTNTPACNIRRTYCAASATGFERI